MKTEHTTLKQPNAKRRKIFAWAIGATVFGIAFRNWIPGLKLTKDAPKQKKQTIAVSINPLAIARNQKKKS